MKKGSVESARDFLKKAGITPQTEVVSVNESAEV